MTTLWSQLFQGLFNANSLYCGEKNSLFHKYQCSVTNSYLSNYILYITYTYVIHSAPILEKEVAPGQVHITNT